MLIGGQTAQIGKPHMSGILSSFYSVLGLREVLIVLQEAACGSNDGLKSMAIKA